MAWGEKAWVKRCAHGLMALLFLTGCDTLPVQSTPSTSASVARIVKVQVYRSSDASIGHYNLNEVRAVLAGVRQTLLERGMDAVFEIQPPIQVGDDWDDLYSQDIVKMSARFRSENDGQLRIFITNKIWSCGSHTYETTVILGCTPVGSPMVVVQGAVDGASDNYGTTDRILWLHEMGHSVQLGHADSLQRVMTPAPQPYSTQLERYEVRQYANLGDSLKPQVVQGAVAAPRPKAKPLAHSAVDVVAEVRKADLHGLDLTPMRRLGDAQLLPLQSLLGAPESLSVQANALAVLGQLGGAQSVEVVHALITQGPASYRRELKEVAVIALAKNENPDVTTQTTDWVIQATRPGFWCANDSVPDDQKACLRLARMAIGALAQSSQPQARAYLQKLSHSGEGRKPPAKPVRPSGDVDSIEPRPLPNAIDAGWANQANQVAAKFLRKASASP